MKKERGYCDGCGADCREAVAWLSLDGGEHCTACAIERQALAVRTPTKPEARDDGR